MWRTSNRLFKKHKRDKIIEYIEKKIDKKDGWFIRSGHASFYRVTYCGKQEELLRIRNLGNRNEDKDFLTKINVFVEWLFGWSRPLTWCTTLNFVDWIICSFGLPGLVVGRSEWRLSIFSFLGGRTSFLSLLRRPTCPSPTWWARPKCSPWPSPTWWARLKC